MLSKIYAALPGLCLALAAGCNSDGERKSAAAGQPASTQQAAASPAPAQPAGVQASAGGASDVCRLLTSDDIKAVQGEAITDAKGSEQASGALSVAQCFYTTPSFNKSVSLALTRKNPAGVGDGGPKEFWEKQFGGEHERGESREKEKKRGREKDRAESREEEEAEQPAQPVKGIGDEAYWVGNQKVGALYVLKGDRFLRISIGGPGEPQAKIGKMKELAKRALKRL